MTLVVEQRSSVAALTRQAAILVRGVRPSYGWLAGVAPPGSDVFDDAGVDGWHVGCRMLERRLASLPDDEVAADAQLAGLRKWVRFELRSDAARWRNVRPIASLGMGAFQDLGDGDGDEPTVLDAWEHTLTWCLTRCERGVMGVHPDDRWILDHWRHRAEQIRGARHVATLVGELAAHISRDRCTGTAPALLREQDVPLVRTLLEMTNG